MKFHFEFFSWLVRALEQEFMAETCGRVFQTCCCIFKCAAVWWDWYHTFQFHCNLVSTLSFLMLSTLSVCLINHLLCFYISVFQFSTKQLRMCVLNITVRQEVFEKFLHTKLFFVKFQTFSLQAFTFALSLIPNTQTRHFLWFTIEKTLKFRKGDNSSQWSLYADLQAAVQNILLNSCS